MSGFHRLDVREVRNEIGGQAKTVAFDVPETLSEVFRWHAGQHITVRFVLDGEEVRRSYSVSSSPFSGDPLRITVKRVKDGLVSNYINDHVDAGDGIDVMPPFGSFQFIPGKTARRTCYFFGAGSGITPLFAMVHTLLCAEPHSVAHLVYGNRDADSILFRKALAELCEEHPQRVTVSHLLSSPSWFSSFEYWRSGQIDKSAIEAVIAEHPPYAQDAQYFICGPGTMNGAVKSCLMAQDVPKNRIHMESYGGAVESDDGVEGVAANVAVNLNGSKHTITVAAGQTLLEAARAQNLDPPFSCQSGVCGACRANLVSGKVHMRARMALEDSDLERGAILACQSVPLSGELEIHFDKQG